MIIIKLTSGFISSLKDNRLPTELDTLETLERLDVSSSEGLRGSGLTTGGGDVMVTGCCSGEVVVGSSALLVV